MSGKIWKVRSMASRCLPVVVDPVTISQYIRDMFSNFRLSAQNDLHGGLMGVKRLGEFYSYRGLRDIVLSKSQCNITDVGTIAEGMMENLDLILRQNPNPLTKSAFVEVAQFLFKKDENVLLVEKVLQMWLQDLRDGGTFPVGSQLYLEQGTSLFLDAFGVMKEDFGCTFGEVMELLLRNDNEEAVLKTFSWLNESKTNVMSDVGVRKAVRSLIDQQHWDGIRALALRAMSVVIDDSQDGLSLRECALMCQRGNVMPLKEAWIVMSGFAAKKVKSLQPKLSPGIL
jgi:hypothetical protein